MSPRYRIVAIAAATNAVFVVPVLVMSIDLDRTCSLFPDGCDGYQYFGVALAFVFALGPGTAAALASALLARRLLTRRHDIEFSSWPLVWGTVAYCVMVVSTIWVLHRWMIPVVMMLGLPALLLLSTRANVPLRARQAPQSRP